MNKLGYWKGRLVYECSEDEYSKLVYDGEVSQTTVYIIKEDVVSGGKIVGTFYKERNYIDDSNVRVRTYEVKPRTSRLSRKELDKIVEMRPKDKPKSKSKAKAKEESIPEFVKPQAMSLEDMLKDVQF